MKRFLRCCIFGMLASLVAGCSSSSTPASPASKGVTWYLQVGTSSHAQAYQGLNYYPNSLTVDVGDIVQFSFPAGEPHTVTFVPAGATPPPADSAAAQAPAGGSSWDGTTLTSSGFVLLGGKYSLTFTKPGTWQFVCLIHQGMVGNVTVNPVGTPYPQFQAAYDGLAATSEANDLAAAQASVGTFPYTAGGLHLAAGISPGGPSAGAFTPATVLRFLDGTTFTDPTTATVPVGSSITWTNYSSNEVHTVTFGIAGQAFPTLNPFAPPSGGSTYDGSAIVNSGVLAPGQSFTLTFTKVGTYTYHCLFHDDTENMIGAVVVQ